MVLSSVFIVHSSLSEDLGLELSINILEFLSELRNYKLRTMN